LRAGLDELGEARSALRSLTFLGEMAEAWGRAGQIADGLAAVEEAIEQSERTEERWVIAELLRIKGELFLLEGAPGARRRPRVTSGRRSTGRTGREPCPGNSERPPVSRGFGETNIALRRRARCWGRFTAASPKVSRRQTCERREACCRN
jgi:hypothetical protein